MAHTPCTFCWRLNTTFVGAVERLLYMISVCSSSVLLIRAWCFRFVMLSYRRGVVAQNLICLVLKFSDGRPSEKHPATAVDTPGSARRGEGGERDLRNLNSWAGNRGGGFVSTKGFHKMRVPGAGTPFACSKSKTAGAGNLRQFGERKKLKNRSQKSKNHNYL